MSSHTAEFRSDVSDRHDSHDYVSRFWQETERYHDLVQTFDENIELTHPDIVTSDGQLVSNWEQWCDWCASSVIYYEYRGPSI